MALLLERVFLERSRRDGRGRELPMVGEPGSFFTMISGGPFALRGLDERRVSLRPGHRKQNQSRGFDVR